MSNNLFYFVAPKPCSSNPCQNEGTCLNSPDGVGFSCVCSDVWEGSLCEKSKSLINFIALFSIKKLINTKLNSGVDLDRVNLIASLPVCLTDSRSWVPYFFFSYSKNCLTLKFNFGYVKFIALL